jgi:hypothetical protein
VKALSKKPKKLKLGSSLTTVSSKFIPLALFVLVFAGIGSYLILSSHAASGDPISTIVPNITGDTIQGSTLTTDNGSWANSPTGYTYQWQDCIGLSCSPISGATNSTYVIQSSDLNKALSVIVTATNTLGSTPATSFNTAAAVSSTVSSSNFVSETYWLGWDVPSTTNFNWKAYNRIMLFNFANAAPTVNTTTSSAISLDDNVTSIPASVTTTIPAGPIMLTTNATQPSSGSYQIFYTPGVTAPASSIPISGVPGSSASPVANADYASGSSIMVYTPNTTNFRWSNSALSTLVSNAHSNGAQVWVSMGGEGDNWNSDCDYGFQYLTGAWYANFIHNNGIDGFNEDNESSQTSSNFTACADAIGQEVHSTTTNDPANDNQPYNAQFNGKVPGMEIDWNATDNVPSNASTLGQTNTNIDAYELEYYGYNPSNDYNCAKNCGGTGIGTPATSLAAGEAGGIPAEKWIDIYAPGNPDSPQGAQAAPTQLSSTTSSASGSVSSIPISAVAAAGTIPAGLIVISDTNSVPTSYQYLETSGVTNCTSGCSLPITGSCTEAAWNIATDTSKGKCSSSTTLNATYASGSDIWLDEINYPQGGYNTGGWDCGTMTSWASDNNLLGSSTWYYGGNSNDQVCQNTIQPFVNATNQTSNPSPTVSLAANPTSITTGSSSSLSWSSSNATACSATSPANWTSSTNTSGSQSVSPTSSTTYSITCNGAGGSASASASVTVSGGGGGSTTPPTVPPALTDINLSADPSEALLTSTATTITLTWGTSTPSSGNVLAGYKLYRNGSLVATIPAGTTMYTDSNLSPGTNYSYTIDAYDTAGHTSSLSSASSLGTSSLIGDLDGDGDVTGYDLITLLHYYNTNYSRAEFDCNGTGTCDNTVEAFDLTELLHNYGQ